jgi:hypothetical protein
LRILNSLYVLVARNGLLKGCKTFLMATVLPVDLSRAELQRLLDNRNETHETRPETAPSPIDLKSVYLVCQLERQNQTMEIRRDTTIPTRDSHGRIKELFRDNLTHPRFSQLLAGLMRLLQRIERLHTNL